MWKQTFGRTSEKSASQDDLKAVRKAARATIFWSRVRPDFLKNEVDAAQISQAEKLLSDGAFGAENTNEKERENASLLELSQSLREAFSQPRVLAREEEDARRAFAPIHAQLMETIESENARHFPKSPRVLAARSNFRWNVLPAKLALASVVILAAALGGNTLGRKNASRELPVQSLVDDFDDDLRRAAPLEFVADDNQNPQRTAELLSENVGVKVDAPPAKSQGVKLLGARRHPLWNRPGVQAHYSKNGVPFALYKIRETRCALDGMGEVEVNGRTYLQGQRGNYHVVVWRSGDNVTTMVSPLHPRASLDLARAMRESSADA